MKKFSNRSQKIKHCCTVSSPLNPIFIA